VRLRELYALPGDETGVSVRYAAWRGLIWPYTFLMAFSASQRSTAR